MVNDYRAAMQARRDSPECSVEEAAQRHASNVRWDRELKNNLGRQKAVTFSANRVWRTQYRPFVKQHCYVEYLLVSNKYQMDSIFPRQIQRIVRSASRASDRESHSPHSW